MLRGIDAAMQEMVARSEIAGGSRRTKLLYLGQNEHKRLANFLNQRARFRWVVSYDDHPEIHALYAEQDRNVHNMNYQVHTRRIGRELIVSSMNCELPENFFAATHDEAGAKTLGAAEQLAL